MEGKTVCLVGSSGRMGKAIQDVILGTDSGFNGLVTVDPESIADYENITDIDLSRHQGGIDVVINFTNPAATMVSVDWCEENKVPLVTGTTALIEDQIDEMKALSASFPILFSPNMSLGVNLINRLLSLMGSALKEFDVEIVEAHHRGKKDSPSGTAKLFANTLAMAMEREVKYGRPAGMGDERNLVDIFVHALRIGSIPGSHDIFFAGEDEEIILSHRAGSNKVFARGAILAAQWILGKEPGFYTMIDVLGL
jgi:4-hydroxy-tetrahydrodipicolinate reductase